MNLSIKQLRAFLILSEVDSFTRAAKKFNLSQPAFSALIAGLEDEIGYRLFDRDTRRVQLNANGIHFIDLARRMVKSHDDAVNEITARAAGDNGIVTLAVLPSIAVEWLPEVLVQHGRIHPGTRVDLLDTQWDRCLKALLDGQADLALTAGQPSPAIFNSSLLFSDKFYLLCHRHHPLARLDHVDLDDIGEYPFIGFSPGTSIRQCTDRLCEMQGAEFNYLLQVRQLTTMMGLIAANYGVCITTGLTLFQFRHKDIAIIPFRDVALERAIYLVKMKSRHLSACAQAFFEFIEHRAQNFQPC